MDQFKIFLFIYLWIFMFFFFKNFLFMWTCSHSLRWFRSIKKIFSYFFWETCVVKVASLNIFLLLLETKRSIPICSPWVPFDLGSLYCLFRRTFAHFTKMCIKKQGKAWAERRERERKVSFLACSADTNMRLLKFPIFRLVVTIKLGFLSERKHPTIYASVATSILRKKRKAKEETFFVPFTLFYQLDG